MGIGERSGALRQSALSLRQYLRLIDGLTMLPQVRMRRSPSPQVLADPRSPRYSATRSKTVVLPQPGEPVRRRFLNRMDDPGTDD